MSKKTTVVCSQMGYSAAIDDAERRMKAGQRQEYCFYCCLWRWPKECGHELSGIRTMRQLEKYAEKVTMLIVDAPYTPKRIASKHK